LRSSLAIPRWVAARCCLRWLLQALPPWFVAQRFLLWSLARLLCLPCLQALLSPLPWS
jgi:hypothetical protein